MMSKKAAAGIGVAAVLLVTLVACVFVNDWDANPSITKDIHSISYEDHDSITTNSIYVEDADGNKILDADGKPILKHNTLNYAVFEQYGPLMLVLAALMFGAMVGGICIAREEDDN
ncbi:MAG: hypothetical protein MJZ21_01385 [archaeon]|nr:hypothetical protein [archaeon]